MEVIYLMIYAGCSYFVARLAQHAFLRSFWAWFVLGILFTPLASLVFVLAAGVPIDRIIHDEVKKKALKKYGETVNLQTVAECSRCGEVYDIYTGSGLKQDKREPWRVFCGACGLQIEGESTLKNLPFPATFADIYLKKGWNAMTDESKLDPKEMESAQFFSLILSLSNSAMLAMGKSPNPMTGKVERDLLQAQQTIDLLAMLKNKTQGNLDDKESMLLENTLTNLRLTCARELEKGEPAKTPENKAAEDQDKGAEDAGTES